MKPLTLEETRAKINDNEIFIKKTDEVPMFSWNTKTKEFYVLGHKFDGVNSIEDFINYIHNLDKENKSLQSQLKAKEEAENTFKEWIATEQFRLARSVSHTYKDSLNKTHLVNEDIFDELAIVLDKYNEILSKGENK